MYVLSIFPAHSQEVVSSKVFEGAIGWPAERDASLVPVKVTDLSEVASLSWERRG